MGTRYNGQKGEALPRRGTLFRPLVYERLLRTSLAEVYERVAKPLIPWPVCKKAQRAKRCILGCEKVEKKKFWFRAFFIFKRQCIYRS